MNTIHPTALVHPRARLGENVHIGPYAVIEEEVVLGDGCSIGAHAVIKRYTRMGRDNRVFEHAVIGGEPQDFKFKACESFVELGEGNLMREGVTIHRGSTPGAATRIGNYNFFMANAHVAHDCTLGDHIVMANGALLGGFVQVEDRAFLSGAVAVHQFCRVGRLAMVAGLARITQDCLPFVVTEGVPGRARGLNVVGLRRAGVSADEIAQLRRAYHLLRRPGAGLEATLDELGNWASPAVAELVRFIRGSARGFAHPRGPGGRRRAEPE